MIKNNNHKVNNLEEAFFFSFFFFFNSTVRSPLWILFYLENKTLYYHKSRILIVSYAPGKAWCCLEKTKNKKQKGKQTNKKLKEKRAKN